MNRLPARIHVFLLPVNLLSALPPDTRSLLSGIMWMFILLTCLTTLLLALLVIVKLSRTSSSGQKTLPGPWGLPWIGNALSFSGGDLHEICRMWADKYGGVFEFYVFNQQYIVVNSYEAVREVLVVRGKSFGGRIPWKERKSHTSFRDILNGNCSPYWKMMRNNIHGNLRLYGRGLAKFETDLGRVIEDLLIDLQEKTGQSIDIYQMIYGAMAVFIMTLVSRR